MVNAPKLHGQPVEQGFMQALPAPLFSRTRILGGSECRCKGVFHPDHPASTGLFRASSLPNRLVKQNACGDADVEAFDFAQHGNAHKLVTQAASESAQA